MQSYKRRSSFVLHNCASANRRLRSGFGADHDGRDQRCKRFDSSRRLRRFFCFVAIFPAPLFNLRVRLTVDQRVFIMRTITDNPDDESKQWSIIRKRDPRLANLALAMLEYMRAKEARLSPAGRLLFNKVGCWT